MDIRMWCLLAALAVGMGMGVHAPAQAQDEGQDADPARALLDSLRFRDGEVAVPGADARLRLGSGFRYLEAADARRVLEQLWGNPPDESVLGLVVPEGRGLREDDGWAVVVTYSDDGHVSDAEAARIDYDGLLADMQQGTREENKARKEAGYRGIELVGWAEPPHYDADAKKLYWAKELAFEGSPSRTLNYDIRVLGRRGYLSLNAVSAIDQLPDVRAGMQRLLPRVEFDRGARYADFDAGTDRVAAYGIAALIGGGLAAKAGLFAKLGALLLGLKKLLVPLLLLLVAGGRKLHGVLAARKQARTVA